MCVLGSMMLSEKAIEQVFEVLNVEDFYRPGHRIIFQAMQTLANQSRAVDLVTVRNELQEKGQLEMVGGVPYLVSIAESVPSPGNALDYSEIVLDKATLRRLESAGQEIIRTVHDPDSEVEQKVDDAERIVFDVGKRRLRKSFEHVRDVARAFFKDVDNLYESGQPVLGVPSGFYDLDKLTGGLYGGDLNILAARPAMGKTSFVLSLALNVARQQKGNVAVFSLEMGSQQLVRRMLSMLSGVSMSVLKNPHLSDDDYHAMADACESLYSLPLYLDDNSDVSPFELRAKCRRLKAEGGLSLVLIDYLQLMRGNRKTDNRTQEVSEIARALKSLAKELDVPVIALAQLSRGVESRPDKRPMLSDIRESGSIEAEADIVMFIYRDAYYAAKEEGAQNESYQNMDHVDESEIIIAKHRNGPTGKVILGFQPNYARFVNLKK